VKYPATFEVESLSETADVATEFITDLAPQLEATVVALSGELGAGKTAFTQAAAAALGISEPVTSPTFVIEKRFTILNSAFTNLIHIDAYRLESSEELLVLDWRETLADGGNLIFLEWPENVADILPNSFYQIKFSLLPETKREIVISYGEQTSLKK
jgi:tRNA threonylcarbamoyladenosine biosynthesis protein TsaE